MDSLLESFKKTGNLHHAYIIEGEREEIREKLLEFIERNLKHRTKANPDFRHDMYDSFSIDDARELRDSQSEKAFGEGKKIFVIETLNMTVEAQNALLKIFEEPTPDTHFFIITPSSEIFLPTLRSRTIILSEKQNGKQEERQERKEVKNFLRNSIAERLELVDEIAEEKDKARAIYLVEGLIRTLHKEKHKNIFALEELLKCRAYLSDRSPSLKLLLEHIALIVPVF